MTIIERVEFGLQTWRLLFPRRPDPPTETLTIWANYPAPCIERGLRRAARKLAAGGLPESEIYQYTTAVARSESHTYKQ
jgi:hypothetical protein